MDTDTPPQTGAGPVPRARWLAAVAIVVLATLGTVLVARSTPPGGADEAAMLQVSPGGQVELAGLPADHQAVYLAVADDPDAFRQVTCYCGCESFLAHRHLLDCFVRPDGGWERHATGCAVCLAEAREVLDLRSDEVPLDAIVDEIDSRFGGITPTPAA